MLQKKKKRAKNHLENTTLKSKIRWMGIMDGKKRRKKKPSLKEEKFKQVVSAI